MKTKIALLVVLGVVVGVWYMRGAPNPFMNRLGAASASVETDYKTEHDWAVREIASDVSEMANHRKVENAPVVVEGMPWHPETFVSYAASELGDAGDVAEEDDPAEQHGALLRMSVDAILKSNTDVSTALKRNLRNPRAHEAAALTLAAFALRESAEGLSNTRWALNRMTAHLAMAQALRNGESSSSIDGQLAEAALLALTHRQTTSASILDGIETDAPEVLAWQRALRMRLNQNWKLLVEPVTATRLEKLEYFRARRMALRGTRAGQDLTDLKERVAPDFARVAALRSLSVEDGNDFVEDGIEGEIAEAAHVYQQMHGRRLNDSLPADDINARAGRLLSAGDPQVLPWGAWAEFANRHIGMWAMHADNHYRRMLGLPDEADQLKRRLDVRLAHLMMYPVASMGRTKGQRGTEADMSRINEAIDVAVSAPELVSYDYWVFIENGSNYEPVKRGMPKRATWFVPASADVPYDLAHRAEGSIGALKQPDIETLLDEAPNSMSLLSRVAQRHKTNEQLTAKVHELLEPRVAYDMYAIESAVNTARDADDRIALRRQACELSISQCLELADELKAKDEAAAAAEYEKAFANPALDPVAMTWSSRWLVYYYERTNQPGKATALARRSAAVGSSPGMQTLALLHEQRGQIDDAFRVFSEAAERYPDCCTPPLAAFLYRQGVIEKKPAYLVRWKVIEREVFSLTGGLQPMATEMKTRPAHGVFVEEDSYWSRRAGLRAGDIIVGVDGWKVDNVEQLDAVLWFKPHAKTYQFTAWRGVLLTAEIPTRHGMTLKTHPLKGWIE
jgi:hypothetical protein